MRKGDKGGQNDEEEGEEEEEEEEEEGEIEYVSTNQAKKYEWYLVIEDLTQSVCRLL